MKKHKTRRTFTRYMTHVYKVYDACLQDVCSQSGCPILSLDLVLDIIASSVQQSSINWLICILQLQCYCCILSTVFCKTLLSNRLA